jgi:hypothetical protein
MQNWNNTGVLWSEEAEVWAKLALVEKRLLILRNKKSGPVNGREHRA